MQLTYGLEEEAFILEPVEPSLGSLYYLGKLFWKNPLENYSLTSPNFCHMADLGSGVMAGIEIATRPHSDPDSLVADLAARRRMFQKECPALIVPMGHLATGLSSSRTCGLHIHIGAGGGLRRIYQSLVHFLPLLMILTASSPLARGRYRGKSFRLERSFAIGPLRDDWAYRFQDIIFSRRLHTVEVRVFDAVWEMERIKHVVRAISAIALSGRDFPLDRANYNRLRLVAAREGYVGELKRLYHELAEIYNLPEELLIHTASDRVLEQYERRGLAATYSAVDSAYRGAGFREGPFSVPRWSTIRAATGLLGYCLPRFPYALWKVLREN